MRSIAIIGSFRKYYEDICGVINMFKNNGFKVTSPFLSKITESRYGFVIFEEDDKSQSEDEIQTETLRKILNADAVYVYNPDGYVGKTTCYEIGLLMAKQKPLYYLERPDDLPVPVDEKQIISPNDFVTKFVANEAGFILPEKHKPKNQQDLKAVFEKPSLLICGSMKFFDDMVKLKNELHSLGIDAIIPEDEAHLPENITETEFNEFKRKVSRDYLKKIRSSGTLAVLVFNQKKNDIENYIGANTFVEIGMAFSWNRKIFLYNDIYPPYADELIGWESLSIFGDLKKVKSYFTEYCNSGSDSNCS